MPYSEQKIKIKNFKIAHGTALLPDVSDLKIQEDLITVNDYFAYVFVANETDAENY